MSRVYQFSDHRGRVGKFRSLVFGFGPFGLGVGLLEFELKVHGLLLGSQCWTLFATGGPPQDDSGDPELGSELNPSGINVSGIRTSIGIDISIRTNLNLDALYFQPMKLFFGHPRT